MLHNHALISSLLLEPWFIDGVYAEMMLPSVIELLEGKSNLQLNPQLLHEKPFPLLLDSNFKHVHLSATENAGSAGLFGSAVAESTAVIPIRGAITKYDGYCNSGVESYMQWIDQAEQSNAETIMFLIDSGGGQANSAFMLAERIRSIQKPTLTYVDSGTIASAAYLIGSASNKVIVSTPVDMVGSIGAMYTLPDFKSLLENTKTWDVYSRLSTEKNLAFRRLRQNNDTTLLEDMLDENVLHFISAVKEYRGDRLIAAAGDPFKGATYTGAQALKMGLIDGIGPMNQALSAIREHTKKQIKTISFYTQTLEKNDTSEMSWKQKLASWLMEQPDDEVTATAETLTPVATTETPAATASPVSSEPTLEQRLTALEAKKADELVSLQAENEDLKKQLSSKPAAAPTTVAVAKELVPSPVEAVQEVTSFMSETDEMVAKLKADIAK